MLHTDLHFCCYHMSLPLGDSKPEVTREIIFLSVFQVALATKTSENMLAASHPTIELPRKRALIGASFFSTYLTFFRREALARLTNRRAGWQSSSVLLRSWLLVAREFACRNYFSPPLQFRRVELFSQLPSFLLPLLRVRSARPMQFGSSAAELVVLLHSEFWL